MLLENHADVHARTRVRPLTVMLDQGPRRAVKTSVQDARQIEAGGSTALLFAAQAGDAESARLLLAAGANVNDTAADGKSALVAGDVRRTPGGRAGVARRRRRSERGGRRLYRRCTLPRCAAIWRR